MTGLTFKSFEAKIDDVVAGERSVVAKITTDAIDRMKECVLPGGGDLKHYRQNAVVLWAHNSSEPPVGRNLWIKATDNKRGLVAKTIFADDEFSQKIFELYQKEFLKAFSIGFRVEMGGRPDPKEVKARPDLAECQWMYRKWELLEYSAVPIPANPEALAMAVSKGLLLPSSIKSLLPAAAPQEVEHPKLPAHRTLAEVEREALAGVLGRLDTSKLVGDAVSAQIDMLCGRV